MNQRKRSHWDKEAKNIIVALAIVTFALIFLVLTTSESNISPSGSYPTSDFCDGTRQNPAGC